MRAHATPKAAILIVLLVIGAGVFAQGKSGKIIFYSDSHISGSNTALYCDGAELASIERSAYVEVIAPAGRHPCVAESPLELPTYIVVLPGTTSYQKIGVTREKEHHAFLMTSNSEEFNQHKHLKQMLIGQSITLPAQPLPAEEPLPEGVFRASANGIGNPRCVYCPNPEYTEKGRRAKIQGDLVLKVVIGTDGKASDIRFFTRLGVGMDESAANTVRNWQFEPARRPDGTPVPVLVPIEITFHLF